MVVSIGFIHNTVKKLNFQVFVTLIFFDSLLTNICAFALSLFPNDIWITGVPQIMVEVYCHIIGL